MLDRGIRHIYIKPATPRLNGKVERSHRIDAEEFYRLLKGVVIDDAQLFNAKLQEWEDFYNFHRPHGGLGGQTPYERLRQKTTQQRTRRKRSTSAAHERGSAALGGTHWSEMTGQPNSDGRDVEHAWLAGVLRGCRVSDAIRTRDTQDYNRAHGQMEGLLAEVRAGQPPEYGSGYRV